jgi:hypothetical protein
MQKLIEIKFGQGKKSTNNFNWDKVPLGYNKLICNEQSVIEKRYFIFKLSIGTLVNIAE